MQTQGTRIFLLQRRHCGPVPLNFPNTVSKPSLQTLFGTSCFMHSRKPHSFMQTFDSKPLSNPPFQSLFPIPLPNPSFQSPVLIPLPNPSFQSPVLIPLPNPSSQSLFGTSCFMHSCKPHFFMQTFNLDGDARLSPFHHPHLTSPHLTSPHLTSPPPSPASANIYSSTPHLT